VIIGPLRPGLLAHYRALRTGIVDIGKNHLQCRWFAEVLIADSRTSANSAIEFGALHQSPELFGITELKSEIVQITQMLIVSRMRKFCLCHC